MARAIATAACLSCGTAFANGAFPSVSQLVADPADPSHMVLRSTFGLLVTRNAGADWDWVCEAGVGYQNIEPPLAMLEGGVLIVGLPHGIVRSDATGCDFVLAAGIEDNVVDVSRVTARPGRVLALSVDETLSRVWESTDAGRTFAMLGAELTDFVATTLDVAPNDADRVYVSGVGQRRAQLLRSDDHGRSFVSAELPAGNAARRPYIAAVAPDGDTVYVRLDGLPGALFVSRDAGATFEQVLDLRVPIQGFALSPDGKSVLATNTFDGSYRADSETLVFERVACRGPSCLTWTSEGLFGCGDNLTDGFILGRSEDQGETFQRMVDLSCVRGPLGCDTDSSSARECESVWPAIRTQLGADVCAPPEVPPYQGCAETDAGVAGSSGSGTLGGEAGAAGEPAATGGTSNPGSSGATGAGPSAESSDCSCRAGNRGRPALAGWLLAALAAFWLRRRATGGVPEPTLPEHAHTRRRRPPAERPPPPSPKPRRRVPSLERPVAMNSRACCAASAKPSIAASGSWPAQRAAPTQRSTPAR